MKGTVADLSNLASKRKAGTITAASFLEEFVGETPWAHVDIAGTAWDVGREYTGKRRQRLRRPPAGRAGARPQPLRTMQVETPWASSLPLSAALRLASAVACLRPR